MNHLPIYIWQEKPKGSDKIPFQWHFVNQKSHMDYPVIELQTLVVMKEKQASGAWGRRPAAAAKG